jgi:hypothetical protein
VAALLFCHGVFGYEHQLAGSASPPDDPETTATQHGQHHGMTTDQDAHYEHPSDGAYFATLLVLLLGTLLVHGIIPACFRLPVPRLSHGPSRPPIFHPPRGPTAPVLQVFRL